MAYGLGKGFLQILVEHQGSQPSDSNAMAAIAKGESRGQRKDVSGVLPRAIRRWWQPLPITPERVPTPVPLLPAGHAQASSEDLPPSLSDNGAAPQPAYVGGSLATVNQPRPPEGLAVEAPAPAISHPRSLTQPRAGMDAERGRYETPCCPICISPLLEASEMLATACGCVTHAVLSLSLYPAG